MTEGIYSDSRSGFFHEAGFERHRDAVDPAVDFVVAVNQADTLCLGSAFEHAGAAAQFQVFDQDDGVAVGQHVAVGVFDDAGCLGCFFLWPFVTAGGAFPVIGMAEDVFEGAGRAGGRFHRERF